MDGFGIRPREAEFYVVNTDDADFSFQDGVIAGFLISFNPEIVHHTRSIYSALDFLGDIGGLYDMLKIVAEVLLSVWSLIVGCGLDAFLLESIFKESTVSS